MLRFVLAACFIALVTADCGNIDRQVVKSQWAKAFGTSLERETLGEKIWHGLFHAVPESRALFSRVRGDNIYSPEFRAHNLRVLGGLDLLIGLLDDQATLDAHATHLKSQHVERKVTKAYAMAFKDSLMHALPATIGLCFNFDVWNKCLESFFTAITTA